MINDEIMEIKDIIADSVECEKIYLFGSYAYGTPHKDSDYDFYVLLKDDSNIKPLDAMGIIEHKLIYHKRLRTPTDIMANYKSRFEERGKFPTMERKIIREGVLLYERE
ncbi:nucleotidyltransferase domain-containing protein [Treponema primitia]|uniref:nucleotidyltransferase domain-containing protein n=1 Tax=Treponema primitia TaxID=88058 RepID=UPI003980F3B6